MSENTITLEGRVSGVFHVRADGARTVSVTCDHTRDNEAAPTTVNGVPYRMRLSYKWSPARGGWDEGWRLDHDGVTRLDMNGGFGSYGTMTDGCRAAIRAEGIIGAAVVEVGNRMAADGSLWRAEVETIARRRLYAAELRTAVEVKETRLANAHAYAVAMAAGDAPPAPDFRCSCERYSSGSYRWPDDEIKHRTDHTSDVDNCPDCMGAIGVSK